MPAQKCLKPDKVGGEPHFKKYVFRVDKEQSEKSVRYKSFVCDQSLPQKLGARQKRNARAQAPKLDF